MKNSRYEKWDKSNEVTFGYDGCVPAKHPMCKVNEKNLYIGGELFDAHDHMRKEIGNAKSST